MTSKAIILLFSFLLCSCSDASVEDFAHDIVESIRAKDAEKLYSLHISPEETAEYGFYAYGINPNNLLAMNTSYPDFVKHIDSLAKVEKPSRIASIKDYINQCHQMLDWRNIRETTVEVTSKEVKNMVNLKTRGRSKVELFDMIITVTTTDAKKYHLSTSFATQLADRWIIYGFGGVPISLESVGE